LTRRQAEQDIRRHKTNLSGAAVLRLGCNEFEMSDYGERCAAATLVSRGLLKQRSNCFSLTEQGVQQLGRKDTHHDPANPNYYRSLTFQLTTLSDVRIEGIRAVSETERIVEFSYSTTPGADFDLLAECLDPYGLEPPSSRQKLTVTYRRYDDGWRIQ
jgi:hypothetical protein